MKFLIHQKITIGHAWPLIGIYNAEEIANKIIKNKLSVRQTEKLVSGYKKQRSRSNLRKSDPNIADLENELSEKIGLKTSINFSNKSTSGSITLYYSNLDQLDDIMERLTKKKK